MPLAKTQAPAEDNSLTEYVPFAAKDAIKLSVAIVQKYVAVKTKSGVNCSYDGYDTKDGAKFNIITAHQHFLKRAELHPEYDGMKSGVVISPGFPCAACKGQRVLLHASAVQVCPICNGAGLIDEIEGDIVPLEQELAGGWTTVFCKNRKMQMHKRIPIGPFRKPFGVWQENPAGMIVKCSEADCLRSTFPTSLGGLYLREEIDLYPEGAPQVTSAPPPSFVGPGETKVIEMPRETQRHTHVPEDDAPPGAEMPAKTSQEPSGVNTPPPETPEEENEPPAQTSAQEPAFQKVSAAGLDEVGVVKAIQATLKAANLADEQLTAWAHSIPGMAKKDQKWADLSANKLKSILEKWDAVGPRVAAMPR
jgi:hypothetical protein